jgi:hypothetical protein
MVHHECPLPAQGRAGSLLSRGRQLSCSLEAVREPHGRACAAPGAPAGKGLELLALLAVDAGRGRLRGACADILAASVSRLQLAVRARVHGNG